MKFIKTALCLAAAALMLTSCQLHEYIGKDSETDKTAETTGTSTGASTGANIPEGVDVNYTMDYMNEDLTGYVTLGEYKGLTADITTYDVTDVYVIEEINKLLEAEAAPTQILDRKTKEGDVICVDYVGTLDGVAFDGGTANGVEITLSENSGYIPGFTDGMYDVMPGETVSYDVTFPDEYENSPDLEGKKTVFTVTVHYIKGEDVVPELDDAFVKEHFGESGCENVDQFIEYYRGYLEDKRKEEVKDDSTGALWGQIMDNASVNTLPKKAVDALYWQNRSNYESYAAEYDMTYDQFLTSYVGLDDDGLREYAENFIAEDIVIYSIVKAEGIEVTEEEFDAGVEEFMAEYDMSREDLLEAYSEDRIRSVIQWNKLMDAILEWNTVNETVE